MTPQYRVIMVRPQGVIAPFVSDDMQAGLEANGHEVMVLDTVDIDKAIEREGMACWKKFIQDIKDFKPDFSMSYGVCGAIVFEGTHEHEDHLFREMGIPLYPCFFDDPIFTQGLQPGLEWKPDDLIFVWDKGHVERMKELGYTNLHHLPLGTNENLFKPLKKPQTQYKHSMSFVGSILSADKILEPIQKTDTALQQIFETVVRRRLADPSQAIHDIIPDVVRHLPSDDWQRWKNFENKQGYWVFVDRVFKLINAIWREQTVTSIAMNEVPISVYGNEDWKSLKVDYHGTLNYQTHLPRLYSSCPLHLNLSAPQLFKAINNRVFDVLASGSMVLSDWREELGDYFEVGKEVLVFHTVEEAVEMAKEWAGRDDELRKMAEDGRRAVLSRHTWKQRMADAVRVISKQL